MTSHRFRIFDDGQQVTTKIATSLFKNDFLGYSYNSKHQDEWVTLWEQSMITHEHLHSLANDNPAMLRACRQAMNALTKYRNELTEIEPGQLLTAHLKKKQLRATLRLMQFAQSIFCNS